MAERREFLVVGLGNPGEEYEFTPHNLGFLAIDRLAGSHAIRVSRKENMSLVGLGSIRGKQVALAKPQTFMNLSGPAVKGLLERYELKPDRLILVYDELDLPWGTIARPAQGLGGGSQGDEERDRQPGHQRILRGFAWESIRDESSDEGAQIRDSRRSSGHKSRKWRRRWAAQRRPSNPYSLKASKSPWRYLIVAPKA